VVSKIVDWAPSLSVTWPLACYPQNRCNGGNTAILALDIQKKGITDTHCVDYSWCANNPYCTSKPKKTSFDYSKTVNLNEMIPNCGCVMSTPHYLYSLSSSKFLSITNDNDINTNRLLVRQHIFNTGPVVGGYIVFKNFLGGNFSFTNDVYIETCDYATSTFSSGHLVSNNIVGAHAVSIMGWGIAKNTLTESGRADVPYWYVRNSWTSNWGEKGYFKIAMYPFNKLSQFDKVVSIKHGNGIMQSGGIILLNVSSAPVLKTFGELQSIYTKNLLHDNTYYSEYADPINKTVESKVNSFIFYLQNPVRCKFNISLIVILGLLICFITVLLNRKFVN
jgi:hypothetical protein